MLLINPILIYITSFQGLNPDSSILATDADKFASVQDLLMSELKTVKTEKKSICQDVISINTGIKGIIQYYISAYISSSIMIIYRRNRSYQNQQT